MKAIYGLYPDPDSAQRAFDALQAAGVDDQHLVIVSSEPFEDHAFGRRDHHTVMPWIAALGAAILATTAFFFVKYTQQIYPLPTGGMPLVPMWTNGIITYEFTMFGAVITTLITLIITARSPRRSADVYDPEVSNSRILIGVSNPADADRPRLENALRAAGAESVVSTR